MESIIIKKAQKKKISILLCLILLIICPTWILSQTKGITPKISKINKEAALSLPLQQDKGPYFFFDNNLLDKKEGVELKVNSPKKYETNPIIPSENPYAEFNLATGALTVLPIEAGQGFRMWYMLYKRKGSGHKLGYAISNDGIHWELPNLGIIEYNGNRNNNLVLGQVTKGRIFVDPDSSLPDKKYKAIFYRHEPHPVGFSVSFSPDGLHWEVPAWIENLDDRKKVGIQGQGASDIVDGFYDSVTDEWVAIFKMWSLEGQYEVPVKRGIPAPRCGRRIIGTSRSSDFNTWTNAVQMLLPDSLDSPTLEFYGIRAVLRRGDWYIGFLSCLIDDALPDGIGWTELLVSRDGRTWQRIRQRFLDHSAEDINAPDHAIAWVTEVLPVNNLEYIYYSGLEVGHKSGNRSGCLAFLKKNRFASMKTILDEGKIQTNPIVLPKGKDKSLFLNVDSANGEVRVQLSDGKRVLKGYSFLDCNPIKTDSIAVPVQWRGKSDLPQTDRLIKIEFQMINAELFSFEF